MNKVVQSYLVESNSLESLDSLLDKFLLDKDPSDIVSTNLTTYTSPYHQNHTTYVAFIIYSGKLKGDTKRMTFWQKIVNLFKP